MPDKYKIIYADPPWTYNDEHCNGSIGGRKRPKRWDQNLTTEERLEEEPISQYPTMSVEDICNYRIEGCLISEISANDSILFMWATYPLLPEALRVIKAWGFDYKSIAFQWIKLNPENGKEFYGLGRWTRGNTEPCLLATKGKPHRVNQDVFQIVKSPIRDHSRKPDVVREKIIRLVGDLNPKIELFARERVEGWVSDGNQLPVTMQKKLSLSFDDY